MKASELRASLLQEAVSGRLVPQMDGEGSAADLLQEIAAERAALVAAGKLKKEKLLPEISEEEIPFEIPESWEWVRLGDLCNKIHYGYTASANISGNAKILRITDIQNNSVDWDSLPYCTVSPDEMTRYSLNNHDILFARTGGTVGKTYLVKDLNKNESIVFASYLIRAVPSPLVNETYLKRFMESPLYWAQIADKAKGTGQDNVNGEKLKQIIFPLPPLSEQRRIVAKLEELMPLVDAYEKEEEALSQLNAGFPERMRKSILQEAVSGKLVPQIESEGTAADLLKEIAAERAALVAAGKMKKEKPLPAISEEEKPFEIPESWEWVRLGEIFSHNNGKQLNASDTAGRMMTYITTSNLYWDHFVLDNLKEMPFEDDEIERCSAINGDLLVCEGGDVGRAAIWDYDYPIRLQNHLHKLRAYNKLETKFYYYCLYYYKLTGKIGGKGIGIQSLSANVLHKICLPLPPISEQQRIVAKVEELMKIIDRLNNQNNI